jgi:hypothetical protein
MLDEHVQEAITMYRSAYHCAPSNGEAQWLRQVLSPEPPQQTFGSRAAMQVFLEYVEAHPLREGLRMVDEWRHVRRQVGREVQIACDMLETLDDAAAEPRDLAWVHEAVVYGVTTLGPDDAPTRGAGGLAGQVFASETSPSPAIPQREWSSRRRDWYRMEVELLRLHYARDLQRRLRNRGVVDPVDEGFLRAVATGRGDIRAFARCEPSPAAISIYAQWLGEPKTNWDGTPATGLQNILTANASVWRQARTHGQLG